MEHYQDTNYFEGIVINLGCLLSEHATKPKDKNLYIDIVHSFLNTIDFYYIPKNKIENKIKELENTCKDCQFRRDLCRELGANKQCTAQLTIKNLKDLMEA